MQKILTFIKKPYAEKGFIIGTFDLLAKLAALFVWCYLSVILATLFFDSMLLDYNPLNKLWWFSYCFFIFFGATWLTYIVFFVRDYNEEDEEF